MSRSTGTEVPKCTEKIPSAARPLLAQPEPDRPCYKEAPEVLSNTQVGAYAEALGRREDDGRHTRLDQRGAKFSGRGHGATTRSIDRGIAGNL